MAHRILGWLLATSLLVPTIPALAQKAAHVGLLANTVATSTVDLKPFHARLSELGYADWKNLVIEPRYFNGKVERLPELAGELIAGNPDVIVAIGIEAARSLKEATQKIPIVMIVTASDAVQRGFVASLARPGGNLTGLASMGGEIRGKRLELLKEMFPKLARVGVLWSSTSPVAADNLKETEIAARELRVELISLNVKEPPEIERAFQTAVSRQAHALFVEGGAFLTANQKQIIDLSLKHRLPTSYPNARYVDAGGLMTYAGDRAAPYRRAAEYVDKILKGTKPADLPVERPMKFELIINLRTAKQIGLNIPPNVLARADRVIR